MPIYSLTCPECLTTLKSSKPVPAGKVLECPKCQVMFAAPATKPRLDEVEVIDDVEVVDDVEVIDDVEVVDDAPAKPAGRRAAAPARPAARKSAKADPGFEVVDEDEDEDEDDEPRPKKKFKSKRKSGSNQALVAGLVAVAVLAVLGGGGALAWWLFFGGSKDVFAYLPANSTLVGRVDFGTLAKDPTIYSQLEQLFAQTTSLPPPFRSYVQDTRTPARDLFDQVAVGAKFGGGAPSVTVVIRSRVSLDRGKLTQGMTAQQHSGMTYYSLGGRQGCFAVPDSRTVVIGQQPQDLVGAGGSGVPDDLQPLRKAIGDRPLQFVMGIDDTLKQQIQPVLGMASAFLPAEVRSMVDGFLQSRGVGFGASIENGEVVIASGFQCTDEAAASQMVVKMTEATQKQASNPQIPAMLGPVPPSAQALMQEMNRSTQYAAQGKVALGTARVKVASLEAVFRDAAAMGGTVGQPGPGGMDPNTPPGTRDTPPPDSGPRGGPRGRGRGGRGGRGG